MNFTFQQGVYYAAGFDKPFIASASAVKEGVEAEGFQVLAAWECEGQPGMPFHTPGTCGDEWDWIAYIRRTGPTKTIDMPSQVKWVQAIPALAVQPGQPSPPPPSELAPLPIVDTGNGAPANGDRFAAPTKASILWLLVGGVGGYWLMTQWFSE